MSRAAHLHRGTRLLNTLSSMLLPLLEFAIFVQMGAFFTYFVSMPEIQPTNVVSRLRKAANGIMSTNNLHPIKVGEYGGMESFYDVRRRQVQDVIRSQHVLSALNSEDRLSSRKRGTEVDVSPETNGGIEGLTAMMLERVVADWKSSMRMEERNSSINDGSIKSCYEYGGSSSVLLSDKCKSDHIELSEQTSALVVFNPLPRKRQWCGHIIEAGQTLEIEDISACQEDWMNLAAYPPPSLVNSDEDDAIEVVTSQFFGSSNEIRRPPNCDVPCTWKGAPYGSFKISGTKWEFTQSAEGPQYYEELGIDPKAHLRDRFYSTTSFRSEIPLPYFSFSEYNIKAPDYVPFDKGIKGASFIANNCDSKNNREAMVRGIMATGFRVDCLSGCLHNAEPHGLSMDNKRLLMRQYLFHLAFENQNEDDYITEKLWGSLEAGIIPVYLGAPNVRLHPPEGSIIVAADFPTQKHLGEYLQKVANDRELYEQYHAWRKEDFSETFLRKYNFTRTHSECRTCRWAYAKKSGLGWDHENQRIAPLRLSREICTDDMSGLASRPFKESYLLYDSMRRQYEDAQSHEIMERSARHELDQAAAAAVAKHPHCSKRGLQSSLVSSHHEIERSLVEHDGVIDVIIAIKYRHMRKGTVLPPLFLRLETIISNGREYYTASDHRGAVSKRTFNGADSHHWQAQPDGMRYLMIQDPNSRISVWTDWTTQMLSTVEGSIDILLLPGEVVQSNRRHHQAETIYRKIRVICEDSNPLHFDTDVGSPTYFAKQQAKDFYHPLEVFYNIGQEVPKNR